MYSASNTNGMIARWISRGATLTELHVPDRNGDLADVVLGFDDESGYRSGANQYFGCTTGRYANRIRNGKFSIDGVEYQLAVNNGPNHLHGGVERSLDKVDWQAEELFAPAGIRFTYESPDGEEGYPGTLRLKVEYTLTDDNALQIVYEATTDKSTIVNLTNHSYFNLSGHGSPSVHDHVLAIAAERFTPVDDNLIPTGELAPVEGTPLDFRTPRPIGEQIAELAVSPAGGYDHNYVLDDFREGHVRQVAEVRDPASGRVMRVSTDQPGMQFYSANGLSGQLGKGEKAYPKQSAFCLETQNFPDAPNKPEFPSAVLQPGETYRHTCIYAFSGE